MFVGSTGLGPTEPCAEMLTRTDVVDGGVGLGVGVSAAKEATSSGNDSLTFRDRLPFLAFSTAASSCGGGVSFS